MIVNLPSTKGAPLLCQT